MAAPQQYNSVTDTRPAVRPQEAFGKLGSYLGISENDLERELSIRGAGQLPAVQKQQRRNLFLAVQYAGIALLATHPGPLREKAEMVRQERYAEPGNPSGPAVPETAQWLQVPTFWTELRERRQLCNQLLPQYGDSVNRAWFRDQELLREMLSAMIRLGNPTVDLYVEAVRRLQKLEVRARELESGDDGIGLIRAFLDRLETQASASEAFDAFYELREAAENFQLILNVNAPELRTAKLNEVGRPLALLLRGQQPVGGMFGEVNQTLVQVHGVDGRAGARRTRQGIDANHGQLRYRAIAHPDRVHRAE